MVKKSVLAGALACVVLAQPAQWMSAQNMAQRAALPDAPQQQALPDAPKPQALPVDSITPGSGTTQDATSSTSTEQPTGTQSASPSPRADDGPQPEVTGHEAFTLRVQTNFVEVPFTVKDNKGKLVPGLTPRDVRVYENGLRQQLAIFTTDSFPLSVALVIDQSMTTDNMTKVNNSLAAMQGAFSKYDEIAVYTYNNGPKLQTTFTGAQSARLEAVLERSKASGREAMYYDPSGPLGQNINLNSGALSHIDPNTNSTHGRSMQGIQNVPRDVHTLNDAILAAATALSKTAHGRRRIVYVISDGKEYGSTATLKQVLQFLQTNQIAVYGTLVGDSSLPVVGFLDDVHLPLFMRDNILPAYTKATGGSLDAQFRQKGIEDSFQKIAEEVRTQYTVGYYTHEPFIDGKYRTLEVKVMRPNLTIVAKKGYYPTAGSVPAPNVLKAQ